MRIVAQFSRGIDGHRTWLTYVATDIFAGARYVGYSFPDQDVSELFCHRLAARRRYAGAACARARSDCVGKPWRSGVNGNSKEHDTVATKEHLRTALKWTAVGVGFVVGAYASYVGVTWLRYGHPEPPDPDEGDALLEQFMPAYEVAERRHIAVTAPADLTFAVACEADLMQSPIIRAIFKARELVLGARPDTTPRPSGVVALTKSIGWRVLAEVPGREVVMGAVTQPWYPNVVFHPLAPDEFVRFSEPDYVKIVWTLRADPVGENESIFRHETRVATTDSAARAKFRRYWAQFSPGIKLIRWLLLPQVRTEAERRAG